MKLQKVLLIGGSGFIGSHIAEKLTERGLALRIATRHFEHAKHLALLPTAEIIKANVHNPDALNALCAGMDAVINLVGVLHSPTGDPYGPAFREAHVELPQKIIAACRMAGVKRLLHMSALRAAPDAPSEYLRSKAAGEAAVLAANRELAVTVFRPSVVFGAEDRFLNVFASLQRYLPVLFLACPDARFQPVYVGDVASAFAAALANPESFDRAYDLAGPRVYTLRELVAFAGEQSGHPRTIIGLPSGLGHLQAGAMEFMPFDLLSRDNLRSMQLDSVSDAEFPFCIAPTALETVAPAYLADNTPRSRYNALRGRAGR